MGIIKMKKITLATVVLALATVFVVNVAGQSSTCVTDFTSNCNDATSTYGFRSCCTYINKLYRTDRQCLCLIFKVADTSEKDAVNLVESCGQVVPTGTSVCGDNGYGTSPSHNNKNSGLPSESKSKLSSGAVAGIVIGVLFVVGVIVTVLVLLLCRKKNPLPPNKQQPTGYAQHPQLVQSQVQGYPQHPAGLGQPTGQGYYQQPGQLPQGEQTQLIGGHSTLFSYEELKNATNGFSKQNEIGRGGFGVVYGGVLYIEKQLTQVAIKRLRAETFKEIEDFKNEVETISRIHHNNLVSLYGYCSTKENKYMVLELVPNGTLDSHLHKGSITMEWSNRMKVALGCAKGISYLHEDCHPQILHRDIKAANILLDNDFVPKVADFGLAKKLDLETVRFVGTLGYMDPEYRLGDQPTAKSDVYSFGVILLELITGRKPIDYSSNKPDKFLVDWVRPLLSQAIINNNFEAIVDPALGKNYRYEEMIRAICCSAICIRHSSGRLSMSQVVDILKGVISIDELKQDIMQQSQSYSNSSASMGYESSHQSSSTAGTANFNEPAGFIRSVNNTSGSYGDQNPLPYGARTGR